MRFLLKFNDGMIIDSGQIKEPKISGEGNLLQMLFDYKKDPKAVVKVEGKDRIERAFVDLYSVEIILE